MTKTKNSQTLEVIDQVISRGVDEGVIHLSTENDSFRGRDIQLKGQKMINFSSCSYLGLELDNRLKHAASEAVMKFGTQFSSSRAYVSIGLYEELEKLLETIYNAPVLVSASTTLGHLSNIPVLIGDRDAIIMDHQVHASVGMACQMVKGRGVKVEMIRHNNVERLAERIEHLSKSYDRIWYMADGLYSMYGDFAPVDELKPLLDAYPQLHLYLDDAHSIGWTGPHGQGHVYPRIGGHKRVYITGSMAKSFGVGGGILIFPDQKTKQRVRNCGGTMIFSGPIQPPTLGAAIASAKIHLSNELPELQDKLAQRIDCFNQTALELNLPIKKVAHSPIFFIEVGQPEVGYNMVKRLMNLGYYTNLGVYPSVPYKNTGLRMTVNNHMGLGDIQNLLTLIHQQLPFALEEEMQSDVLSGKTSEAEVKAHERSL
ncbi:MAG: aminotransferase class I/II-fold pyridoxal phosphate-dependent enzyme [Bacteroidota bacterium]